MSCIPPCKWKFNTLLCVYWIVLQCCQVLLQNHQPMTLMHIKPSDAYKTVLKVWRGVSQTDNSHFLSSTQLCQIHPRLAELMENPLYFLWPNLNFNCLKSELFQFSFFHDAHDEIEKSEWMNFAKVIPSLNFSYTNGLFAFFILSEIFIYKYILK